MVGKTCLALAPPQNHWWQVAFHVTARGFATGPMPYGGRTLDAEFDFVAHELVLRTSAGAVQKVALRPRSVAEFYRAYLAALDALGVHVRLWPVPVEVEQPVRFPDDDAHASYDPEYAQRHWRILLQADDVFRRFRAAFLGKCSPVHFFWGGPDLAVTRFSGRPAPTHPGGVPNLPDRVTREAMAAVDVAGLRRNALDEINQFEEQARSARVPNEVVLAARYVLCAALDEAVLSTPWGNQSAGRRGPGVPPEHLRRGGGSGEVGPAGARAPHGHRSRWLTAMMLPSLSLNHAVFAPPPVAMLFFILIPGMSYSSNTTPRALSTATSASTSSTCQNAWLALDVPALGVGYMKTSAPPHA